MRFPLCLLCSFLLGLAAVSSCDGDSSVTMSVWPVGGATGLIGTGGTKATGGSGGRATQVASGGGGAGGVATGGTVTATGGATGGTMVGGSISVPGGMRDRETAQCTAVTGPTCPVSNKYLSCLKGICNSYLVACYRIDATSGTATGTCAEYASCMLACPCNETRLACESICLQDHVLGELSCGGCLNNLLGCNSLYGCGDAQYCDLVRGTGGNHS